MNVTPGGSPTYRVLVTDSQLARVEVFDLNGGFVGQWGTKGSASSSSASPPASRTTPRAASTWRTRRTTGSRSSRSRSRCRPATRRRPSSAFTSPTRNQVLDPATVIVTGTAADNAAVGTVAVSVRDLATGRYWNALDAVWGPTKTWNLAGYAGRADDERGLQLRVRRRRRRQELRRADEGDRHRRQRDDRRHDALLDRRRGAARHGARPRRRCSTPQQGRRSCPPAPSRSRAGRTTTWRSPRWRSRSRTGPPGQWWNPGTGTWGSLQWMPAAPGRPGQPPPRPGAWIGRAAAAGLLLRAGTRRATRPATWTRALHHPLHAWP